MKMFIANMTKQNCNFYYRLPEVAAPRMQTIPIGGQIQISGELSQPDIDYIVKQKEKYGMIAASEIDRSKPFVGLCYSVGSPVRPGAIEKGIHHNIDVLVRRGHETRRDTAITINNRIENDLDENRDLHTTLKGLDVSVQEVVPRSGVLDDHRQLNEGFRVERDQQPGAGGRRGRRGRQSA